MFRIIFAFMVTIHGLIHLPGFLKEWKLASIEQITGPTLIPLSGSLAKIVGTLWLFSSILFIISAITFLQKKEWWIIAAITILLSQTLIFIYWKDAKFGTIVNIIILAVCIVSYGNWRFNKIVSEEVNSFFPGASKNTKVVNDQMVNQLPFVVQKWLRHSKIIGKNMSQTVFLTQKGEMRTTRSGKWLPFEAKQYFTIKTPAFIWKADIKAFTLINLFARDKYVDGKGHMLVKLLSLFSVADARGKEIDQGTMLRYLAECIWFPSSALSDYLTWKEIDSTSAKATMSYMGITASGIFKFDSDGDFLSFSAKRYYSRKEGATLEDWLITADENGYREFEGIRIPARATVTWKLKEGDFTWLKIELTHLNYNSTTHLKSSSKLQ